MGPYLNIRHMLFAVDFLFQFIVVVVLVFFTLLTIPLIDAERKLNIIISIL
jgi:hypothetical protein